MIYTPYDVKNWEMLTPTTVEFEQTSANHFQAILDNDITVEVPHRSSVEGQLRMGNGEGALIEQYKNGSFFVVDNHVVDYRLKDDLAFVHKNKDIQELINRIGLTTASTPAGRHFNRNTIVNTLAKRKPIAASCVEQFECDTLNAIGGLMDIKLGFKWSPFAIDIDSVIEMWRLVCDNGMVVRDPMMNHKIPMMNQWQENIAVANQVIRHNFDKRVMPRIAAMPSERITMADLRTLRTLVGATKLNEDVHIDSQHHLEVISDKLDGAWNHFADRLQANMLKFVSAPVSAFDAMNIATEIATHHTAGGPEQTKFGAFVNKLVFDTKRTKSQTLDLEGLISDVETFADTDRAFFGETCH